MMKDLKTVFALFVIVSLVIASGDTSTGDQNKIYYGSLFGLTSPSTVSITAPKPVSKVNDSVDPLTYRAVLFEATKHLLRKSNDTLSHSELQTLRAKHIYLPEISTIVFENPVTETELLKFTKAKGIQMSLIQDYDSLLKEMHEKKVKCSQQYTLLEIENEQKELLDKTCQIITVFLTEKLFPLWLGTGWDYNGTTTKPQTGKIACGYFVSTTLQQAGLKVERIKLAQQASMNIMKTVCDRNTILKHTSVRKLIEVVKTQGAGIYITGLSDHVGFIINKNHRISFCHSYGTVMWEDAALSPKLNSSRYLATGKIGRYAALMWLTGQNIDTITSVRR